MYTVHHSIEGPYSLPGFGPDVFNRKQAESPTIFTDDTSQGFSQVVTAFEDKLILAAASFRNQSDPQEQYVGVFSSRSGYQIAARQKQLANLTNPSIRFYLNTTLTNPDAGEISPELLSIAVDNNAGVLYWSNSEGEIWAYSIDDRNSSRIAKHDSNTFSNLKFDYRHNRLFAVIDDTGEVAVLTPGAQDYSLLTASPFKNLVSLAIYHRQGILFILTMNSLLRGALPLNSQLPIPDFEFCGEEPNCGAFTQIVPSSAGMSFQDIAIDQTKGQLWVVGFDGVVRLLNSITCAHFECDLSAVSLKVMYSTPSSNIIRKLVIEEQQVLKYGAVVANFTAEKRVLDRKVSPNNNEMIALTDDGKLHTVVHFTSTIDENQKEVFLSTFAAPIDLLANNTKYISSVRDMAVQLYPYFDVAPLLSCSGSCKLYCLPGFTPSSSGSSCEACPINMAKNSSGIEECSLCRTYLWPLSYEDPGNATCIDHVGDEILMVFSVTATVIFVILLCLVLVIVIIIVVVLGILIASRMNKTKKASQGEPNHTVMPQINENFGGIHNKASIRVDTTRYDVSADEFKILQKIGSGTYSNVYKAEFRNDVVALKRLNLATVTDETASNTPGNVQTDEVRALTSEFEHEASLLATLRHKNIVSFVAAVTIYPNYAIATEYMEMGSLFDILKRVKAKHQQMSWKIKLQVLCDVAKGMEYLHRNNLIHRDLKSPNILLDSKFTAKVSDFGLSRMKEKAVSVMTANVGSPLWLAPEVTLGQQYDNKCDVFSFGIVMWELLTNEQPYFDFQGPKIQIHMKVATDPSFRPTIPSSLTGNANESEYLTLMRQCWEHDPTKRPAFGEIVQKATSMTKS